MKKTIAFFTALLICSFSFASCPAEALEAATYAEYTEQMKEKNTSAFPDSDAKYSVLTEDDFTFHLYEEYAVLAECTNRDITEAVIPEEVQGLPVLGSTDTPFGYCRKLTTIRIPDHFQYFEWADLTNTIVVRLGSTEEPMPSVSEVTVSETNPYYTVSDGLLYTKDMKTLVGCPPAMGMKTLSIDPQTEIIGDYAFFACMNLEEAVIPSHIEHIHNGAFAACLNLVRAELPERITSITGDLFYYCTSLTDVTCRGEIQTIGYGAFNQCTALTEFSIPDTVTYIGNNAFEGSGCIEVLDGVHYVQNWVVGSDENVQEAKIREGTVGIAELSFFLRSDVAVIDIPESVKYIGDMCFGITGEPSVVYCRNDALHETVLAAAKTATDIYIYDPDCAIFDSEKTIPAAYRYTVYDRVDDFWEEPRYVTGDVVIHGYAGSTAQAYAEKYQRQFALIYETNLSGDVNGDGAFTVSDVILLQKWLLAVPDTHLADWKAADFSGDGKLDVIDLCLMKNALMAYDQGEG